MLRQLRSQKFMRTILRITLILVIPSFVFYYGFSQLGGGAFGNEYARLKQHFLSKWHRIYDYDVAQAEELKISELGALLGFSQRQMPVKEIRSVVPFSFVVQATVDYFLLEDYARQHKIMVSSQELLGYINSLFPENTRQNFALLLRRMRKSEGEFLNELRYQFMIDKAQTLVGLDARVSLFELWQSYLLSDEELKVALVRLSANEFKSEVSYTTDALREYFAEEREQYRKPEMISLQFVELTAEDLETTVTVSEAELSSYYDSHLDEFTQPRMTEVRHIQLNFPDEPTQENLEALTNRMKQVYDRAVKEDFAEVANETSEDPGNVNPVTGEKQGGLLGMVSRLDVPRWGEEFVNATTSLEEGQISSPVLSQRGFHILKAEKIIPETITPFEKVRQYIYGEVNDAKLRQALLAKAPEIDELAQEYTTLSALARELGVSVEQTGLHPLRQLYFPELGDLRQYRELLEELPPGEVSETLPIGKTLVMLQIKERIPSRIPDFQEVVEEVRENYLNLKARERARETAELMLGEINDLESMNEAAKKHNLEVTITEPFTRLNLPNELRGYDKFARTTLATTEGAVTLGELKSLAGEVDSFVIWLLLEKTPPSKEEFRKELPELQRDLLALKQRVMVEEFLRDQRERYDIRLNPRLGL